MTFASWAFHNPISFDKTRKRVEVAMNPLVLGVQSKTRPFSLVSRSTQAVYAMFPSLVSIPLEL